MIDGLLKILVFSFGFLLLGGVALLLLACAGGKHVDVDSAGEGIALSLILKAFLGGIGGL